MFPPPRRYVSNLSPRTEHSVFLRHGKLPFSSHASETFFFLLISLIKQHTFSSCVLWTHFTRNSISSLFRIILYNRIITPLHLGLIAPIMRYLWKSYAVVVFLWVFLHASETREIDYYHNDLHIDCSVLSSFQPNEHWWIATAQYNIIYYKVYIYI